MLTIEAKVLQATTTPVDMHNANTRIAQPRTSFGQKNTTGNGWVKHKPPVLTQPTRTPASNARKMEQRGQATYTHSATHTLPTHTHTHSGHQIATGIRI